MNQADSIKAVERAHQDGALLAHMFETPQTDDFHDVKALCKVLHGNEGAFFSNTYRKVAATEDGYCGLATTALKKGFPVPVWNPFSDVGFLFDSHEENAVKPVHVSSGDSYSMVEDGKLAITWDGEEVENFSHLAAMQGYQVTERPPEKSPIIDFSDSDVLVPIIRNARSALNSLWEIIEEMGWDNYRKIKENTECPGLNEINIVAHMRGLKGIIVTEALDYYQRPGVDYKNRFVTQIERAVTLSHMLQREYGDLFPEPPTIFAYDPARSADQLVAMDHLQLEHPDQFYLSRHHTAAVTPPSASATDRITKSR